MIYPKVIRADGFHCRKHLLVEDLRLQPQLAVATPAAIAIEIKLNNNNHGYLFGSTTLLI